MDVKEASAMTEASGLAHDEPVSKAQLVGRMPANLKHNCAHP
jgi:hypothetical protein